MPNNRENAINPLIDNEDIKLLLAESLNAIGYFIVYHLPRSRERLCLITELEHAKKMIKINKDPRDSLIAIQAMALAMKRKIIYSLAAFYLSLHLWGEQKLSQDDLDTSKYASSLLIANISRYQFQTKKADFIARIFPLLEEFYTNTSDIETFSEASIPSEGIEDDGFIFDIRESLDDEDNTTSKKIFPYFSTLLSSLCSKSEPSSPTMSMAGRSSSWGSLPPLGRNPVTFYYCSTSSNSVCSRSVCSRSEPSSPTMSRRSSLG